MKFYGMAGQNPRTNGLDFEGSKVTGGHWSSCFFANNSVQTFRTGSRQKLKLAYLIL